MIRRCVRIALLAMLVSMISTPIFAGTTGKISGTVTDEVGTPLPGVGVTVDGTRLGASTDADGMFVILQVPPGQMTVSAQLIGYRTVTMTDVGVRVDRTTEINFRLPEEAIEMDAVIVTAERPPIEQDVTSSLITVDARRMAEAPVTSMLSFLTYEPGVTLSRGNELQIRGGGPSEIRFRVDGLDRTDGLTGKAYTQLNQMLVAEVTVLTGGFNAEYGNVRSGMVNVVVKDGTEGGGLVPWVAGAATYAPAQRKHFGPGLYDEDQYDYWLMSSKSPFADIAIDSVNSALYWPLLYEETRDHPSFTDPTDPQYRDPRQTGFLVFGGRSSGQYLGWQQRADLANAEQRSKGTFGYNKWTAEQAREAWEWESNMNETSWQYAHRPDYSLDLAAGWALPQKTGGLIVGYRREYEMTVAPALRPYSDDQSFETKLTLTPTDNLKVRVNYMTGWSKSTGVADENSSRYNPELAEGGAGHVIGADPISMRSASDLVQSLGMARTQYNKLNLSNNGYLDGDFSQYGASLTYTVGPTTFFNASIGRSSSSWELRRDLPRADTENFSSSWIPPTSFGYGSWLTGFFGWTDVDGDGRADNPVSIADATTPGRAVFNTPFRVPNKYSEVPSATVWVTKDFVFNGGADTVTVVSPQGWMFAGYQDLSRTYSLGGGGTDVYTGDANQWVIKGDVTHAIGSHTFKTGMEYISSDLEYHVASGNGLSDNMDFRDYGGEWPAARPNLLGLFVQDKMETDGMIANVGVRLERFDAGHPALLYSDVFNVDEEIFSGHGREIFTRLVIAAGWDTLLWGNVPAAATGWQRIDDSLRTIGSQAPRPGDVVAAVPADDNIVHWQFAPRFGISHPVSQRSKLFFNYGIFYSMQKPSLMYGIYDHDGRLGGAGETREIYNPSLRPAKTTMYEVGIEHVLPFSLVTTFRAYAKYNVDQASTIQIVVGGRKYSVYRNSNYEDIRGAEVKVQRTVGRFVNGWFSYEKSASRAGEVGLKQLDPNPSNVQQFEAFARSNKPEGTFRALLQLSTPRDWGEVRGGWSLSVVQTYRSGGEVLFNPDPQTYSVRDMTDENYIPQVDYWNTDLKFAKSVSLAGRRNVQFYLDITNLWNAKRLNLSSNDYNEYLYFERLKGRDVKWGEDTHVFTRPYRVAQSDGTPGYWKPPLAPRMDWALFLYPRYYRFGVRFEL